jgi:hypothetical protein
MIGGLSVISSPVVGGTNLGVAAAAGSGAGALPADLGGRAGKDGRPAGLAGGIAGAGLGGNFTGPAFAPILGAGLWGS